MPGVRETRFNGPVIHYRRIYSEVDLPWCQACRQGRENSARALIRAITPGAPNIIQTDGCDGCPTARQYHLEHDAPED